VDAAPARVNAALQPPSELRELRGLRELTRIGATVTSAAAATDITRTRGYRKWKNVPCRFGRRRRASPQTC